MEASNSEWYLLLIESSHSSGFAVQASDVGDAAEARLLLGGRACHQVLHAAGALPSCILDLLEQPFCVLDHPSCMLDSPLVCFKQAHSKTDCYARWQ